MGQSTRAPDGVHPPRPKSHLTKEDKQVIKIQALFRGRQSRRQNQKNPKRSKPPPPRKPSTMDVDHHHITTTSRSRKPSILPQVAPEGIRPPSSSSGSSPSMHSSTISSTNIPSSSAQLAPSQVYVNELEEQVAAARQDVLRHEKTIAKCQRDVLAYQDELLDQKAQMKHKDYAILRKDELLEAHADQDARHAAALVLKSNEIQALTARIRVYQVQVDEQAQELSHDGEDFETLERAMEAKMAELASTMVQVQVAESAAADRERDIARLQGVQRRLEKDLAEKNPDVQDACLSARSFEENQLIKLRDDALVAKTKEIWVITGQNDRLRHELDQFELEIQKLQQDLIDRDTQGSKQAKDMKHIKKQNNDLLLLLKQYKGKEQAVEMAMHQNVHLLSCLQTLENEKQDLTEKCTDLQLRYNEMETEFTQLRAKASRSEVEHRHSSRALEQKLHVVEALQQKLEVERNQVHESLESMRREMKLKLDTTSEELNVRREKQYQLLQKLQTTEAAYYNLQRDTEGLQEHVAASGARMQDMEKRVQDAKAWRDAHELELRSLRNLTREQESEFENLHTTSREEREVLSRQLSDMKHTVLQEREKTKDVMESRRQVEAQMTAQGQLVQELQERVGRLVKEATKEGRARAQVGLEAQMMENQLHEMKSSYHDRIQALHQVNEDLELELDQMSKHTTELQDLHQLELESKWNILELYTRYCGHHVDTMPAMVSFLHCRFGEKELHMIRPLTHITKSSGNTGGLERLMLGDNLITDGCIPVLLQLIETSVLGKSNLAFVDLRRNGLSISGIRELASGIRELTTRRGDMNLQVYFKNGQIEIIDTTDATTDEESQVMCKLDVRDNNPEDVGKKRVKKNTKKSRAKVKKVPPPSQQLVMTYGQNQALLPETPQASTMARKSTSLSREQQKLGQERELNNNSQHPTVDSGQSNDSDHSTSLPALLPSSPRIDQQRHHLSSR